MSLLALLKRTLGKHFYRGGVFHPTKNYAQVINRFRNLPAGKIIVNIGSGGYDPVPGAINIDPYRGGPHTVRAFGENLPFQNQSVDVVICAAVLEHVKEPEKIIGEAWRVLKVGGELYVEVPFLQPYHAAPGDFHRWTIHGLKLLCRDYEEVESGITSGPGSAVAWLLVEYSRVFFKNQTLRFIAKNLTKIAVASLKYFDKWLIRRGNALGTASGLYILCRKNQT